MARVILYTAQNEYIFSVTTITIPLLTFLRAEHDISTTDVGNVPL